MASSQNATAAINVDEMEQQLLKSIEQDKKRKCENDAKIRAVQQGVPNYEAFRQIVQGCHLKPLEKKDKASIPQFKIWNTSINLVDSKKEKQVKSPEVEPKVPETPMEFYRRWKAAGSTENHAEILSAVFEAGHLDKVLVADVLHLMSGDLLSALDLPQVPGPLAVAVLRRMAAGTELRVLLEFLTEGEQAVLDSVFKKLDPELDVSDLRRAYSR